MNNDFYQRPSSHVKTGIKVFVGIFVIAGIFMTGVYVGYENRPATERITSVINKTSALTGETDFNPFWKAWSIVDEKFAGAEKTSDEERIYGAIKGMLASFDDPYTTFFPPSENSIFESEISGSFSGVGIEIGKKDDILTVIAPLKDTPADRAGIKSGDKIVKINDVTATDISIDKAITLIRGKEGTKVTLTIIRENSAEPKIIVVERAKISLPTIKTEARPEANAFVIHLYNFSSQSPELFYNALKEYIASGYPNLVLDLRGNPGGYLDASVLIGSWFIPEGKAIVKEIGKNPEDVVVHTSKGPLLFPKTSKLIILVDRGSASASEILAGALSEQGIGLLVGEQTYGKGSVQEVVKLTSDTSLKITVAKWYTPNGVSISENGLTPKVKIESSVSSDLKDIQLEKALTLFSK